MRIKYLFYHVKGQLFIMVNGKEYPVKNLDEAFDLLTKIQLEMERPVE
jgi:hypothetical protein